jgi:predicted Zn-dependent protease
MSMIENLEAMLARGQDSALLRYGLGNEYLKAGRHEEAIGQLAEAVRQDPGYSAAWKLYGKALTTGGRPAEALKAFDKGIETAEARGDIQAAKEMRIFRKRAEKAFASTGASNEPQTD